MSTPLGNEIASLRAERGWSQGELAKKAEVPNSSVVSRIEAGASTPTVQTLTRLASAFGISPEQLLKLANLSQKDSAVKPLTIGFPHSLASAPLIALLRENDPRWRGVSWVPTKAAIPPTSRWAERLPLDGESLRRRLLEREFDCCLVPSTVSCDQDLVRVASLLIHNEVPDLLLIAPEGFVKSDKRDVNLCDLSALLENGTELFYFGGTEGEHLIAHLPNPLRERGLLREHPLDMIQPDGNLLTEIRKRDGKAVMCAVNEPIASWLFQELNGTSNYVIHIADPVGASRYPYITYDLVIPAYSAPNVQFNTLQPLLVQLDSTIRHLNSAISDSTNPRRHIIYYIAEYLNLSFNLATHKLAAFRPGFQLYLRPAWLHVKS